MRHLILPVVLILAGSATAPNEVVQAVTQIKYAVIARYPHDTAAFTEGLLYRDGMLIESTGREGQSDIRKVRLSDGKVLQSVRLPAQYFGEGIADWKDELVSVTWTTGIGYRWNLKTLKQTSRFSYPGEGWGMTQDGKSLILSDGTPNIRFLNPLSFKETRRISVTFQGRPVKQINELEWVKGAIYANIWQTPVIARIDPISGKVTGFLDLSELVKSVATRDPDAVLNGIAYDGAKDRLLITGKNWPTVFAIKLVP